MMILDLFELLKVKELTKYLLANLIIFKNSNDNVWWSEVKG